VTATEDCSDDNECTIDSCVATIGCSRVNREERAVCNAGAGLCDGAGQCFDCLDAADCSDGNDCTTDDCTTAHVCANTLVAAGEPCAGGTKVCDASGACVQCLVRQDCPSGASSTYCSGASDVVTSTTTYTCDAGVCTSHTSTSVVQDCHLCCANAHCENWNWNTNSPCAAGTCNKDCYGDCGTGSCP
jgi:hypothetical protein